MHLVELKQLLLQVFNYIKMNRVFLIIVLVGLLGLSACEEVAPSIDFTIPLADTSYVTIDIPNPQDKVVFIEEFSGVTCVNCPEGNAFVEGLLDKYPGRVISSTLHAGSFAVPISGSDEDFAIEETEIIDNFLGVEGYPAASVDRQLFTGELIAMNSPYANWEAATEAQLQKSTPVNIDLVVDCDKNDQYIKVSTKLTYTKDSEAEHNLSLFLLESKIIDPQLSAQVAGGYIANYEHNHVVRDMLTSPLGISISNTSLVEGLTVIKEFELELADNWVVENCEIIAIVHKTGDSKEVVHGAKDKLEP